MSTYILNLYVPSIMNHVSSIQLNSTQLDLTLAKLVKSQLMHQPKAIQLILPILAPDFFNKIPCETIT